MAAALLPSDKRRAVRALYAFPPATDDLVDRLGRDPFTDLERALSTPFREHVASAQALRNVLILSGQCVIYASTRKP